MQAGSNLNRLVNYKILIDNNSNNYNYILKYACNLVINYFIQKLYYTGGMTKPNHVSSIIKQLLMILLLLLVRFSTITLCEKKHLNFLILVPWPDSREHANWDVGLELIPGGRMAAKEINSRSDVLNGYDIRIIEAGHDACGLVEHSLGLVNLVYFGVNQKYNVTGVLGLFCSPSTVALSSIASNAGICMIQLSASNSPVFNERIDQFPHLWRFLESASVYANMMIHLMQKYKWSRIAIVSNQESVFYDGIAASLVSQLRQKQIHPVYQGHLIKLIDEFQSQVLLDLSKTNARIIFVAAQDIQVASMLCEAYDKGMLYPNYLWIIADWKLRSLIDSGGCNENVLREALEGCILSNFNLLPPNGTQISDLSLYSYDAYLQEYYSELENVKLDYQDLINKTNTTVSEDVDYSSILYDQVWAFSLALNASLPDLEDRNISLQDYHIGQPQITRIIENNLKKLNFRGVSGHVKFNEFREVYTPINVYQIQNRTSVLVGVDIIFNNSSSVKPIGLSFRDELDDDIPVLYQTVPYFVTAVLLVSLTLLLIFTTAILILVIKYRNFKEIKAISVKVSMLMFLACHFCILGMAVIILLTSIELSNVPYSFLCNLEYCIIINSCIMLFGTLYIKMERVHSIFYNKSLKIYNWKYSNQALYLKAIGLCLIGALLFVIAISIKPVYQDFFTAIRPHGSITATFKYPFCQFKPETLYILYLFYPYLGMFLLLILYLSSKTKNIKTKEFKNTKVVNFFLTITVVVLSISIPFKVAFFVGNKYVLYLNVVNFYSMFLIVLFAQLMLFVPSVLNALKKRN